MAKDNASPKSVEQLAKMTGAEARLLDRFLRVLAADRMVEETGSSEYTLNGFSTLLTQEIYQGLLIDCIDASGLPTAALPEYLKSTGYKNPISKDESAWKFALKTPLSYFEYLAQPGQEYRLRNFNLHMTAKNEIYTQRWFEVVPVHEALRPSLGPDSPLIVDVGGNVGHDLIALHEAHPELKGKLVLQDLPGPIAQATNLPAGTEKMEYSFFTPQPVKEASAYYFHQVLHDWPDDKCREILKNQIPAMKKGHSKILIDDLVIPDQGAGWLETGIDMLMLTTHSAQERTQADWRSLLDSVGLKMTKLWDCKGYPFKLIEAELA
ncbi:S-adenosyl-L-methionine-dependent methyltransferase [Mytilinidion resinicola]|uniref:S-adenosyl-L-methionine-dependent methyltransferase n=1 Tax=Mytilinidion resinicola TaxID=574789 RepID=A0A6A6YSV8_9PEZI|nr:S-adenosyl-L-methionine-dependent methyltransferase [Mytilinidion resinicola]KAF2811453.1 S-adenosyl-L-methionine-dependent methyltransferase [Mytilinidion resinicola]